MSKKTFPAAIEQLHNMLSFVEKHCQDRQIESYTTNHILISVEEVVVNIIHYGYEKRRGIIEIECEEFVPSEYIKIQIVDDGCPYNPVLVAKKIREEGIPVKGPLTTGGYGILLYSNLMDQIEYQREEGLNHLFLIKYL